MEAGLGSLEALELQNSIATHFEIEVSPTLAFDYPSIASMAAYLAVAQQSSNRVASNRVQSGLSIPKQLFTSDGVSCIMGVGCRYPKGKCIIEFPPLCVNYCSFNIP